MIRPRASLPSSVPAFKRRLRPPGPKRSPLTRFENLRDEDCGVGPLAHPILNCGLVRSVLGSRNWATRPLYLESHCSARSASLAGLASSSARRVVRCGSHQHWANAPLGRAKAQVTPPPTPGSDTSGSAGPSPADYCLSAVASACWWPPAMLPGTPDGVARMGRRRVHRGRLKAGPHPGPPRVSQIATSTAGAMKAPTSRGQRSVVSAQGGCGGPVEGMPVLAWKRGSSPGSCAWVSRASTGCARCR
jgi:hypothetical protein